jgi:hypothetical protein
MPTGPGQSASRRRRRDSRKAIPLGRPYGRMTGPRRDGGRRPGQPAPGKAVPQSRGASRGAFSPLPGFWFGPGPMGIEFEAMAAIAAECAKFGFGALKGTTRAVSGAGPKGPWPGISGATACRGGRGCPRGRPVRARPLGRSGPGFGPGRTAAREGKLSPMSGSRVTSPAWPPVVFDVEPGSRRALGRKLSSAARWAPRTSDRAGPQPKGAAIPPRAKSQGGRRLEEDDHFH